MRKQRPPFPFFVSAKCSMVGLAWSTVACKQHYTKTILPVLPTLPPVRHHQSIITTMTTQGPAASSSTNWSLIIVSPQCTTSSSISLRRLIRRGAPKMKSIHQPNYTTRWKSFARSLRRGSSYWTKKGGKGYFRKKMHIQPFIRCE